VKNKIKKALGESVWFKIILAVLIFIPSITERPYDTANTSDVIAKVLAHPLAASVDSLLPIAKLLLLAAVIVSFFKITFSTQIFLGYYAFILLVVGIFQNMANTDTYGFTWLVGNTLVIIIVLIYCIYDIVKQKSVIKIEYINKKRLWVFVPMALAFLMPYSVDAQNVVQPSLTLAIFTNESGVTYCMITPIIIGIMLIFSKGIYKPLLSVISYVGLIFGILNMMTWFILQNQNWWMGVLHFPLLILSIYCLAICKKE
jgi:hypothetical protein